MIGSRVTYETPQGNRVQVLCIGERASLPVFDIEVVNRDGEVVEYLPNILGHTGLMFLARKRNWREAI